MTSSTQSLTGLISQICDFSTQGRIVDKIEKNNLYLQNFGKDTGQLVYLYCHLFLGVRCGCSFFHLIQLVKTLSREFKPRQYQVLIQFIICISFKFGMLLKSILST